MRKINRSQVTVSVFLLALLCGTVAILWPQFRDELRAQGYYDCYLTVVQHDPQLLPETFDWRDRDLPSVRNQEMCGSCWAYSAIGTVEGTYAIRNHTANVDLSEQNLVSDCGCPGSCFGGWPNAALEYIKQSGVVDEACFPYQSMLCLANNSCLPQCDCGGNCSNPCICDLCGDSYDRLLRILDYKKVSADIDEIKRALICYGPLSVTSANWWHAIVLVGYDDETGDWIIRNSWGSCWPTCAEGGYGRIPYVGHHYSDIVNNAYYIELGY
jgi:C1A family cysteine protease